MRKISSLNRTEFKKMEETKKIDVFGDYSQIDLQVIWK